MESRIIESIKNAGKILIVTHTGPDGDAVGSAFGVPPVATQGALAGVSKGLGVVQNVRDRLSGSGSSGS